MKANKANSDSSDEKGYQSSKIYEEVIQILKAANPDKLKYQGIP